MENKYYHDHAKSNKVICPADIRSFLEKRKEQLRRAWAWWYDLRKSQKPPCLHGPQATICTHTRDEDSARVQERWGVSKFILMSPRTGSLTQWRTSQELGSRKSFLPFLLLFITTFAQATTFHCLKLFSHEHAINMSWTSTCIQKRVVTARSKKTPVFHRKNGSELSLKSKIESSYVYILFKNSMFWSVGTASFTFPPLHESPPIMRESNIAMSNAFWEENPITKSHRHYL